MKKLWMKRLASVLLTVMALAFLAPLAVAAEPKEPVQEEVYVVMTARQLDGLVRAFNSALAELERAKKRTPRAFCS